MIENSSPLASPENVIDTQSRIPALSNEEKVALHIWCGRKVISSATTAAKAVVTLFTETVNFTAIATEDSGTLSFICRKLDRHILAMIQQLGNAPTDYFKRLSTSLKSVMGVLDFAQVAVDIDYFVQKKFKKDNNVTVCGKISLAISDVGYALLWLQELGLTNLSKAAAAISNAKIFSFVPAVVSSIPPLRNLSHLQKAAASVGNIRVFSFVDKISLHTIAETTLGLAYMFFAVKAYQNFAKAITEKDTSGMTSAVLEGFYLASELAIDGLLLAGYTNILGLGVMAATSVVLAVSSLAYRSLYNQQKKRAQSMEQV